MEIDISMWNYFTSHHNIYFKSSTTYGLHTLAITWVSNMYSTFIVGLELLISQQRQETWILQLLYQIPNWNQNKLHRTVLLTLCYPILGSIWSRDLFSSLFPLNSLSLLFFPLFSCTSLLPLPSTSMWKFSLLSHCFQHILL